MPHFEFLFYLSITCLAVNSAYLLYRAFVPYNKMCGCDPLVNQMPPPNAEDRVDGIPAPKCRTITDV